MQYDYAFEMGTSNIRYGPGTTHEVGMDLAELQVKRVMVLTDRNLDKKPPVEKVLESISRENIAYSLFQKVRVEPTDSSFKDAIEFARSEPFDAFVAVGGGSTIDTAKVANLYATYHPDDFLDYVNPPLGKGMPVPGDLKPLFALPTTAGTGSETTGVAIFDLEEMHAKTGIAHRRLKPTLGIVDPDNTKTLPPMVAGCTGLDVLTHAIESYTALPFNRRPLPDRPVLRPAYQGSNPVSDVWAVKAIEMACNNIVRIVEDPTDAEARNQMIIAATYAGIGFGNAGTHLGHGMSYPVSGMVRSYIPEGYPDDRPIIPHGMAVVLNAPAVFRFTAPSNPERHLEAARLLNANISNAKKADVGDILADVIISLIKKTGMPNGLSSVGFTADDVDRLVEGTLPQHRVTGLSPRPFTPDDLKKLFLNSLTCW